MKIEFTKRQRKELRKLSGIAYQRDLDNELTLLDAKFSEWRSGQLSCFDLSQAIHEHHDGPARSLFVFYTRGSTAMSVASAIVDGLLKEDDVPESTLDQLQIFIEGLRRLRHIESDEQE